MSDGDTTPKAKISNLKALLSENYSAGFTVLREIIQNASDAGARKLLVVCLGPGGLAKGRAPFQVSGLLFVNDGTSQMRDRKSLNEIGDSGKAADSSKVGKFGLGQKSLFHYCDAFFYAAFDGAVEFCDSLNPYSYEGGPATFADARSWEATDLDGDKGSVADAKTLRGVADSFGFRDPCFVLWAPFRQDGFHVGGSGKFSDWMAEADGDAMWRAFHDDGQIAAALAFTSLESVELRSGFEGERRRWTTGTSKDRFAPFDQARHDGSAKPIAFDLMRDKTAIGWCAGLERLAGDDAALDAIKNSVAWPKDDVEETPEKAEPHGAVTIVRTEDGEAQVALAAYLPLDGGKSKIALPNAPNGLSIYLHGTYFTDRGRRNPVREGAVQTLWNRAIFDRVTLRLLGPALLEAFRGKRLSNEEMERTVKSLVGSTFRQDFFENPEAPGLEQVLAYRLKKASKSWDLIDCDRIRPVPPLAFEHPERFFRLFPVLAQQVAAEDIVLVDPARLLDFDAPPQWQRSEIETVIDGADRRALQERDNAEMLAAFLARAAQKNLPGAGTLLQAAVSAGRVAEAPDTIKAVLEHAAPWRAAWVKFSPDRGSTKALAAEIDRPPITEESWKPGWAVSNPLTFSDLRNVLPVLANQLERGEVSAQRMALAAIGATGESLDRIARDETLSDLQLLRGRDALSGNPVTLSLSRLKDKSDQGRLLEQQAGQSDKDVAVIARALDMRGAVVLRVGDEAIKGLESLNRSPEKLTNPNLFTLASRSDRFGEVDDRSKLLKKLKPDEASDSDALRNLCAGRKVEPRDCLTCVLEHEGGASLETAIAALADAAGSVYVPDSLASEVFTLRRRLGIETVGKDKVAGWIADHGDIVEGLEQDAREALISFLGEESRPLALHQVKGGGLVACDQLWRPGTRPVPTALSGTATLLDPAKDRAARAVQEKHVWEWSALAEVETVLSSSQPDGLADVMLDALGGIAEVGDGLKCAVRKCAWLREKSGAPLAPKDILDLDAAVENAAKAVLDGKAVLSFRSDVAEPIRRHAHWDEVCRTFLPPVEESRDLLLAMVTDAEISACLGDSDAVATSNLAKAGFEDGTQEWRLLTALLREQDDERTLDTFGSLTDCDAINNRLRRLGAFAQEKRSDKNIGAREALKRAIEAAIEGVDQATRERRLKGVLVPTAEGNLYDASTVTTTASVAKRHLLAAELVDSWKQKRPDGKSGIEDRYSEGQPTADSNVSGSEVLLRTLEPLYRLNPVGARRCYALFGLGEEARREWVGHFGESEEGELDAAIICMSKILLGKPFDRTLDIREPGSLDANKIVEVRAIDGTLFMAPIREMLGSYLGALPAADGETWQVTMQVSTPSTGAAATQDLRDIAAGVVHDVWQWANVKEPIIAAIEATGRNDTGYEPVRAKIEEHLPETLRSLSARKFPGLVELLDACDAAVGPDSDTAKSKLWKAAQGEEERAQLRDAVCSKIVDDFKYGPERTLLELFQNAHDAYAEVERTGDVRIALSDDRLTFEHWGRTIGTPSPTADEKTARAQSRDLHNMLKINWSDKGGDSVGQFGLGFKCVHLLSATPGIVSGTQSCRIHGGFMPEGWGEGFERASGKERHGHKVTLIDLPLDDEKSAKAALDLFEASIDGLLLFSGRCRSVEIECDGVRRYSIDEVAITDGLRVASIERDDETVRYLLLSIGDATLALKLNGGVPGKGWMPERSLWRLAPLGRNLRGHWMLDAPFRIDAGRTGLAGEDTANTDYIASLAGPLRERLIELFDEGFDDIRPEGEAGDDFSTAFWSGICDVFSTDYSAGGMRSAIHRDAGWARTARTHAILPEGRGLVAVSNGAVWIDNELAHYRDSLGMLTSLRCKQLVDVAINGDAAQALGLGKAGPKSATAILVDELSRTPNVTPDAATVLGAMVDLFDQNGLSEMCAKARFESEGGGWQPLHILWADPPNFAPQTARLSASYDEDGKKLFDALRDNAGAEETLVIWAKEARDDDAKREVLAYVRSNEMFAALLADDRPNWLGTLTGDVATLARRLGLDSEADWLEERLGVGGPISSVFDVPRETPKALLLRILEWWMDERDKPIEEYENRTYIEEYERRTYPEEHQQMLQTISQIRQPDWEDDPVRKQECDTAWFTLLALGCFRTLPWNRETTNRSFLNQRNVARYWNAISATDPNLDAGVWHSMLTDWYDTNYESIDFHTWRRSFGDLYTIRRFLPEYQKLFEVLPVTAQAQDSDLRNALTPATNSDAGVDAPPLYSLLRHGAPWIIRELVRHAGDDKFYSLDEAASLSRWCWSPRSRMERFFKDRLGLTPSAGSSEAYYEAVRGEIREKVSFDGDHDLPLDILSDPKNKDLATQVLGFGSLELGIRHGWDSIVV